MVILTKKINRIILFDFFTEVERAENRITIRLCEFFTGINMPTTCYFPNSRQEAIEKLNSIINIEDLGNGTIIHFIGHGVTAEENGMLTGVGFGNKHFNVRWGEIKPTLVKINNRTNDGLIINSSIMCYGNSVFRLINTNDERPFFAAIGCSTTMSLQASDHNIGFYKACATWDRLERRINWTNDLLEESQGLRPYELKFT